LDGVASVTPCQHLRLMQHRALFEPLDIGSDIGSRRLPGGFADRLRHVRAERQGNGTQQNSEAGIEELHRRPPVIDLDSFRDAVARLRAHIRFAGSRACSSIATMLSDFRQSLYGGSLATATAGDSPIQTIDRRVRTADAVAR
jgi:hypothetical protein